MDCAVLKVSKSRLPDNYLTASLVGLWQAHHIITALVRFRDRYSCATISLTNQDRVNIQRLFDYLIGKDRDQAYRLLKEAGISRQAGRIVAEPKKTKSLEIRSRVKRVRAHFRPWGL